MARQLDYQAEADVKQREAVWALVKGLAPAVQKEHHAAFVQRLKVEEAVSVLKVAVETWTGLPDNTVRGYYAEQVLRRQLWALTARNKNVIDDYDTRGNAMKRVPVDIKKKCQWDSNEGSHSTQKMKMPVGIFQNIRKCLKFQTKLARTDAHRYVQRFCPDMHI